MTWFLYSDVCLRKTEFSLQKFTLHFFRLCECGYIVTHSSEQKELGVGEGEKERERGRDRHCLSPRCQDYRNEPPHPLFFGSGTTATAAAFNCQLQSTLVSPGSSVCLLNAEAFVKVRERREGDL